MYKFGKRSKECLATMNHQLVELCNEVIKHYDFSVIEGHRSLKRQKEMYDKGLSKLDGVKLKGNHNYMPSMAMDIIPYSKGHNPFDGSEKSELMFYRLNREFQRASRKLDIPIVWGGTWNSPRDYPHYEVV